MEQIPIVKIGVRVLSCSFKLLFTRRGIIGTVLYARYYALRPPVCRWVSGGGVKNSELILSLYDTVRERHFGYVSDENQTASLTPGFSSTHKFLFNIISAFLYCT